MEQGTVVGRVLGTSDATSTPVTATPGASGTITARTAPTFTGLSEPTATTRTARANPGWAAGRISAIGSATGSGTSTDGMM